MGFSGIASQIVSVGKGFFRPRRCAQVCNASTFQVGMRVRVCRVLRNQGQHGNVTAWQPLTALTIKKIPTDRRGRPTNELIFDEPLPANVEPGDLVFYEEKR